MCQDDMRDSVSTFMPARTGPEIFDHRWDSTPSVEIDDNVELLFLKSQFGSLK